MPLPLAVVILAVTAITTPAGGDCGDPGKVIPGPPEKGAETEPAPETAKKEFGIKELVARLRATKAIGFFTKLALKNQIDDLLGKFRCHHAGTCDSPLLTLREEFNLLLMKVLSLLQDNDPDLFRTLAGARDILWNKLTDPTAFAEL
ncbi:MAG: hypothetical protein ACRDIC_23355 [bacterium]